MYSSQQQVYCVRTTRIYPCGPCDVLCILMFVLRTPADQMPDARCKVILFDCALVLMYLYVNEFKIWLPTVCMQFNEHLVNKLVCSYKNSIFSQKYSNYYYHDLLSSGFSALEVWILPNSIYRFQFCVEFYDRNGNTIKTVFSGDSIPTTRKRFWIDLDLFVLNNHNYAIK